GPAHGRRGEPCAADRARSHRVTTLRDTSGAPLAHGLAAAPDAIKPDLTEPEEVLGPSLPDVNAVAQVLIAGIHIRTRPAPPVGVTPGGVGPNLSRAPRQSRRTLILRRPDAADTRSRHLRPRRRRDLHGAHPRGGVETALRRV